MDKDTERQLKIYEIMDQYGIDADAAEQLLMDEEERNNDR